MIMLRTAAIAGLALVLAGCGRQAELKRTEGIAPPPVAHGADKPATPDALLMPGPQLRPIRNDDLLSRSAPREEDPFDLPPDRNNGR